MAAPGTIISQIQATPTQPTTIPQVTASPTQLQQIQSGAQQNIAISQPQQVPLPPTISPPKENTTEASVADSATQNVNSMSETTKENIADGKLQCMFIKKFFKYKNSIH